VFHRAHSSHRTYSDTYRVTLDKRLGKLIRCGNTVSTEQWCVAVRCDVVEGCAPHLAVEAAEKAGGAALVSAKNARDGARAGLRGIGNSSYTPVAAGSDGDDIDWDAYRALMARRSAAPVALDNERRSRVLRPTTTSI
jgi:hypothetical protein